MLRLQVRETIAGPRRAFSDRVDAGVQLAAWIDPEPDPDALVLGLPRGGVPVGAGLAMALGCELRPVLVRKLPIPADPEMGFGAITLDGTVILNHDVVRAFGIGEATIRRVAAETRAEVERRSRVYPGGQAPLDFDGRNVWLVDDGLATGLSAVAAARMIRSHGAEQLTVAVPCGPLDSARRLLDEADEVWCMIAQEGRGFAVASFYRDFHEMDDAEVVAVLESRGADRDRGSRPEGPP